MKKTFYLMRHGQTLFNVRRKIQGACDSPLTEQGIIQAKEAGERLKGINFDHFYSSTAERASDTLELVVGESITYQRLKGLKEMNFGTFEGESEDLNPKTPEGYKDFFLPYGGESQEEVKQRMKETCLGIMEKDDHQIVLAVSHAGACFHFMRNWITEEEAKQAMMNGAFSNCAICKYEYENKQFNLIEIIRQEK